MDALLVGAAAPFFVVLRLMRLVVRRLTPRLVVTILLPEGGAGGGTTGGLGGGIGAGGGEGGDGGGAGGSLPSQDPDTVTGGRLFKSTLR